MKLTRINTILALALALASGYYAYAQRGGFGGGGRGGGGFDGGGGGFGGGGGGRGQRNNYGYSASVQSTNVPGPTDYQRFSGFISQRNIFDPDRYALTAPPRNRTTTRTVVRSAPAFGLVGTMAYEKGMFAFFDGNSPEYQKVLYESESNNIAGFIVAEITTSGVKLQTADKKQTMTFKIGDTLQQQNDGTWDIGGSTGSFSSAGGAGFGAAPADSGIASSPSTEPGAAAAPVAPSAAVQGNDILRRLMQERQQQLK